MKYKFNNIPNKEHELSNGDIVWESRSVAVVAVVCVLKKDDIYFLVEQRSKKMDQPLRYCLPCGYLDYNENGVEAVTREIYEETGLYLNDIKDKLVFNNDEQPFFINTDPKENRQNVSLSYCFLYDFGNEEIPNEILNYKNSEIEKVEWVPIENLDDYDFAFNHLERIDMFIEILDNLLNKDE